MHTCYTLSYTPGSILSDTNYYIALYVFLVVSMATNIVYHLAIILYLGFLQEVDIISTVRPYLYSYFTTPILVLKFANKKMYFFEEIQDSDFPRKVGYFCIHLHEFGEKGG